MMDIAVPTNKNLGFNKEKQKNLNGISYGRLKNLSESDGVLLIDLREPTEIKKKPSLLNSINIPYSNLQEYLRKEELKNKTLVFYCAVGERSALAIQISQSYQLKETYHLVGGLNNL